MKSLNTWLCGLSCLLIGGVSPVMAQDSADENESNPGAKGLYYQQMEEPNVPINTGVQYWIELHRDGETIHANNKTQFHSGDAIRFHVKPNINGFAYIVLRDSVSGEKSQLFPNTEGKIENNHIVRGKEMLLPASGTLAFDQNAGTEKLTLLISRKPIDPKAYLDADVSDSEKTPSKPPQRIAMAISGSKDLIPNQVLVSYVGSSGGGFGSSLKDMPAAQHQAVNSSNSGHERIGLSGISSLRPSKVQADVPPTAAKTKTETFSKDVSLKTQKSKPVLTATADVKPTAATSTAKPAKKPTAKHSTAAVASAPVAKKKNSLAAGVVTVVYKNPDGVLAADISLEHI